MSLGGADISFYDETMSKAKILVVDDEPGILEMISDALAMSGFEPILASDGLEALNTLRSGQFDLLVTDVNMPKMDGYELVRRLRQLDNQIPVIFLTARNDKPDVANGFRIGADDYITKPFGIEEFSLRVAAVLRRTFSQSDESEVLRCGPLELNESRHEVRLANREVALSPTEFRLLAYLMENQNKVLTKHMLLDKIWGINFNDSATVVDTYISYLRKKLHDSQFQGIKTIRGVGFMISDKA